MQFSLRLWRSKQSTGLGRPVFWFAWSKTATGNPTNCVLLPQGSTWRVHVTNHDLKVDERLTRSIETTWRRIEVVVRATSAKLSPANTSVNSRRRGSKVEMEPNLGDSAANIKDYTRSFLPRRQPRRLWGIPPATLIHLVVGRGRPD